MTRAIAQVIAQLPIAGVTIPAIEATGRWYFSIGKAYKQITSDNRFACVKLPIAIATGCA